MEGKGGADRPYVAAGTAATAAGSVEGTILLARKASSPPGTTRFAKTAYYALCGPSRCLGPPGWRGGPSLSGLRDLLELVRTDRLTSADDLADRVGGVPVVDDQGRPGDALGQVPGDEPGLGDLAAAPHHQLVPFPDVAEVRQRQVELVGEEVGDPVVALAGPGQVPAGQQPLVEGLGPVLDADPPEQRVLGVGDVAGGEHAVGRPQPLVDQDAVVDREAGPLGQVGVGPDPDPDDHNVGGQPGAVSQHHRLDTVAALQPLGPGPGPDVHAPVAQEGLEELAHLGTDGPRPEGVGQLQDGHPGVHLGGAGGHLGADEAATEDDHGLGSGDRGPQPLGVVHGAQVVDALQVLAGQLQSDRLGAGGQDQAAAVVELVADLGGDRAGRRVEGAGPGGQERLDVVVAVPGLVVGAGRGSAGPAAGGLLGQAGAPRGGA